MSCSSDSNLILDKGFKLTEGCFIKITQSLNIKEGSYLRQRLLTLGTSFVIFGFSEASFFVGTNDYQLGIVKDHGSMFVLKGSGIKEDRIILFAHGNGKLIHDPAVYTVIFVLGKLSYKSYILIGYAFKSEKFTQEISGKNLYGCRR